MNDPKSIFRALTTGISFDKKRFRSDAEKFGLTCKKFEDSKPVKEVVTLPDLPVDLIEESNDAVTNDESSDSSEEQEFQLLGNISVKTKKRKKVKTTDGEEPKAKKSKSKLFSLHKQQVNHYRNVNRIHVFGSDIPDPIDSWQKLESKFKVDPALIEKLQSRFLLPTPVQMQAIPLLLDKRQVLVCAPTGSGKTAAYLVPLLHLLSQKKKEETKKKSISAVIVAPTRELALQIYRECVLLCEGKNIRAFVIDKVTKAPKKLASGLYDIVVTTPNRVVYMLQQNPPEISLKSVDYLIIDESDKLFEAGERGFRDQLAVIYKACGDSGGMCCAMFSATMAPDVEQWCKLNLDNPVTITIGERNRATDTVEQKLLYTTEKSKFQAIKDLIAEGLKPPVLVFVQSKTRAKELHSELAKDKSLHVDVIHSERSELQRDNTVKAFRAGNVWILICTELLGRGIDFKGVNMVINYDFPATSASYIHRIGRTGRAGRSGKAVTFFTEKDATLLRSIAQVIKNSGGEVPDYMLKMKKATRQEKRYLAKHAVNRETISRESKYDREKREKLQKAIAKSKKIKLEGNKGDNDLQKKVNESDEENRVEPEKKKKMMIKSSKLGFKVSTKTNSNGIVKKKKKKAKSAAQKDN